MVDSVSGSDLIDGFDSIPDPIVLHIFNRVSDVKALIRCRCVSRRFNSLVPQIDSLLLRVDRVISAADADFLNFHDGGDGDGGDSSFLLTLLASLLKPLHNLFASSSSSTTAAAEKSVVPCPARSQSPTQVLRCFECVRNLRVELPSSDGPRTEKGTCVKWRAAFGKTLKHCVIFAYRENETERESCIASGLKTRVVWTISALMAASARHYMILEAINEQKGIENLVIQDRECEGTVVMDKYGLQECREGGQGDEEEDNAEDNRNGGNRMGRMWWSNNRTSVPAVRMRMRHKARLELSDGVRMEGATLVVVRPINDGSQVEEQNGDVELAMGAFGEEGGVCAEAVQSLLKGRSYILEMNSF